MSDARDQIAALSRAVHATDAGRRVGWGRAYSAEASRDELARDVNMLRAERDILYRFASFLFGLAESYDPTPELRDALSRYQKQVGAVLDSEIMKAGRIAGETARITRDARTGEAERRKAERRRDKNAHSRDFKAAREQERKQLMKRFGIPNEASLYEWLERFPCPSK